MKLQSRSLLTKIKTLEVACIFLLQLVWYTIAPAYCFVSVVHLDHIWLKNYASSDSSFSNTVPRRTDTLASVYATTLNAVKRTGGSTNGKGFAKKEEPIERKKQQQQSPVLESNNMPASSSTSTKNDSFFALQSIDASSSRVVDDETLDATPEERASALLRNKYGMKTLAEQQLEAKQLELYKERQRQVKEWKKKLEKEEDIDIISLIPSEILVALDLFLKVGVTVCGITFILSGLAITVEAYTKATGNTELLSPSIESFIVDTIEPNFTTGLLVLLGFSVSLGALAAAQLGSQGATYREKK